ncbi:MAG: MtnX-like HAD-IB family phosphatase [Flavobacteriales bacterium]|nr:MAG: phosphoserine phosphatase [Chlorobi bacterium OLB6]MBE2265265.1 MtnX-like HAD-IB family phosphatase [Flavobacteriales bacterium]MBV6463574.1 2-hydroxy-3-keto-5-methylthiopentenyl-1-phosphate phosphatase [Chlorobiota bacterium]MBW7853410.1 MtnX-like HAD-IB family phosphatase [Candidatus Kapabacteria bacterium]MCC6330457.1 MtnX-like HAD-IB family phosphatase [Ignavibacteria bacterium]
MLIAVDFDGTISCRDTSDDLFAEFGSVTEITALLVAGRITVAEYYDMALASLADTCTPEVLAQWLNSREIDSTFISFLEWLRSTDCRLAVVSDGFDAYIYPILHNAGITIADVACNTMRYTPQGWRGGYPGASESCSCFCAGCKRNALLQRLADDEVLVYIGDGMSDTCAVQFADVVFAKGYLASWCTEHRIPHHPWRRFSDIQRILATKYATGAIRRRRQAHLARKAAFINE